MGKTKLINEYSIKYHRKRLKHFFKEFPFAKKEDLRDIDWWANCIALEPLKAGKQAVHFMKDLIRMGVIQKKITIPEAERLWDMLRSQDEDSRYVALALLEVYYPYAFLKEKQ